MLKKLFSKCIEINRIIKAIVLLVCACVRPVRRALLYPVRWLARAALWSLGFWHIKVRRRSLRGDTRSRVLVAAPHFSLLDCGRTRKLLGDDHTHWRVNLRKMLEEEKAIG